MSSQGRPTSARGLPPRPFLKPGGALAEETLLPAAPHIHLGMAILFIYFFTSYFHHDSSLRLSPSFQQGVLSLEPDRPPRGLFLFHVPS